MEGSSALPELRARIVRGAAQIGGSCVEVEYDSARLVVDVGLPLEQTGLFRDLLPDVPGLWAAGDGELCAVLIPHTHPDHCGLADLVTPDVLQQEVESLTEDIEDPREPVEEFELFDQCAYTIGVTQYGTWGGATGFLFGDGTRRRPALAIDMRVFRPPQYDFLAFPGEEPPSIECNEDAGEEFIDG